MKRPAVFFDRDNTLIAADGYLGDPNGVKLIDGAAEAVARTRRMGFAAVTFSNQSGVARGLFTEDAVRAVNRRMDDMLKLQVPMAIIEAHEFCPFHPDGSVPQYKKESELRKPRPGMLLRAAQNLTLDLSRSWVIGDAPRDIEAGHAAGCRTILVKNDSLARSPAAEEPLRVEPDFVAPTLKEAMDFIEKNTARTVAAPAVPIASESVAKGKPTAGESVYLEKVAEQILIELKKRNVHTGAEFSISKLLAGIVQILTLPVLFFAYLHLNDSGLVALLLLAIYMQTLVVALIVMGKQK